MLIKKSLLFLMLCFLASASWGRVDNSYTFYAGLGTGFADTDWSQLVTDKKNFNLVTSLPIGAHDYGALFDLFLGYQFTPAFAVQAEYTHLPLTTLTFNEHSAYFPSANHEKKIDSKTSSFSIISKFLTPVSFITNRLFAFAGVGLAFIHRSDVLVNTVRVGADFSAGFSYDFYNSMQASLVVDYESGYGKSSVKPAASYIPFVYQVQTNISYFF